MTGSGGSGGFSFPCDVVGAGAPALLLPALSSISTRAEMRPLAERLSDKLACFVADWPGFGQQGRTSPALSPALLERFLDRVLADYAGEPIVGIAAGHGAGYLVKAAHTHPGRFSQLVLIAPTWRGPLPTMTGGRREGLCRRVRMSLEMPVIGHVLYRLNVSRPVVRFMLREHVYADPKTLTADMLAAKLAVARRAGGRFGTAAFVTGGLDPVASREAFLALFGTGLPPVLLLRPRDAPARSGAEMDALAATGRVTTVLVGGALSAHEECPDEVGAAITRHLATA